MQHVEAEQQRDAEAGLVDGEVLQAAGVFRPVDVEEAARLPGEDRLLHVRPGVGTGGGMVPGDEVQLPHFL